ncbi:MAG TPA: ABC transporter ATP-binding protein [Firmicutes bacterium]|nr:ABC transporter ATP-binding protein [Bacillota bacterium]
MSGICTENLTMQFKQVQALEDVSVCFGGNQIYGLLGRNGAGKTTLLNIITNRMIPSSGRVLIDGEPAFENDRALEKVYYMGEKTFVPDTGRVEQFFNWTRSFYPNFQMEEANRLADAFGLNRKQKLKNLSTGYTTIVKLIAALASGTPYVLFDEPVLGLDANHRELFYRELISNYSTMPRTIVISTHLIEEIADIIEQVVIIKNGRILLDQSAEEVRRMGYSVSGKAAAVDLYCEGKNLLDTETLGGLKTASLLGSPDDVPEGLEVTPLDLQKLFIRLTNA